MTRTTLIALLLIVGCASLSERQIQSRVDPIVTEIQRVANGVRDAAADAASLGVPGASIVALLAGAVGTAAGFYNERRRRTAPLRAAMTQVVRSVDAAFPQKTEAQKAALAAAQDSITRKMVRELKDLAATDSQR